MQNTNYSCHEGFPPILITIFDKFNLWNNVSLDAQKNQVFVLFFYRICTFVQENDLDASEGGGKNNWKRDVFEFSFARSLTRVQSEGFE